MKFKGLFCMQNGVEFVMCNVHNSTRCTYTPHSIQLYLEIHTDYNDLLCGQRVQLTNTNIGRSPQQTVPTASKVLLKQHDEIYTMRVNKNRAFK